MNLFAQISLCITSFSISRVTAAFCIPQEHSRLVQYLLLASSLPEQAMLHRRVSEFRSTLGGGL